MTKSRVLRLILYPFIALASWWAIAMVVALITNQTGIKTVNFGVFDNIYFAMPFLMTSALLWFNEKPKPAFILGITGGIISWLLMLALFALSKDLNPPNVLGLIAVFIFISFSSGIIAWLIASLRKK